MLYAPGDIQIPRLLTSVEVPPISVMEQFNNGGVPLEALGPQAEVIAFYLSHQTSPQVIKQLFQEQEQKVQARLDKMMDYLQTQTCRRQIILNYFGESKINQSQICCDIDLPHWTVSKLDLPAEVNRSLPNSQLDWRRRLNSFFNL